MVIVKNFKMPIGCRDCSLSKADESDFFGTNTIYRCALTRQKINCTSSKRHSDCPLLEMDDKHIIDFTESLIKLFDSM